MEENTFGEAFGEEMASEATESMGEDLTAVPPTEESEGEGQDNQNQATEQEPGQEANQEEPVSTEDPHEAKGLLAAKQAEKAKRKEAEAKVSTLEQRINDLEARLKQPPQQGQQQQKSGDKEDGDFWDDPDANVEKISGDVEAVRRDMQNERLSIFEELAREKHSDFDEKYAKFEQMAASNPVLVKEMVQSRNPGEYVYQTAKKALMLDDIGDPETYKERIIKEYLANQEKDSGPAEDVEIPGSLLEEKSYGGNANQKPKTPGFDDAFPE